MESIATPAIVVDEQTVESNLQRMADYVAKHNLKLRPHIKTHKSKWMAQKQLAAGATGLTVAKVGEAEVMSEVCDDIFVAYPSVGEERCRRLAELASKVNVRVGLDSKHAADGLATACQQRGTTAGVLVDFDLGVGRTGVQSIEASIELAKSIQQQNGLRLDGIMLYTGHVMGDPETQTATLQQLNDTVNQLVEAWKANGLSTEIVSSGSTPAAFHSHLLDSITEIRPGTYIYNDINTIVGNYCQIEDSAAKIHATVVSNTVPHQVVIDAGSKTLTSDRCGAAPDSGHGHIVEFPKAKIVRLTEEHAQIDITNCDQPPQLGQVVTIIPNHICVCMNMQDQYWVKLKDGSLQKMPIDARGLLV